MKASAQLLIIIGLALMFCGTAFGKKYFLTASDINNKIADHTMTITEAADKKTGKKLKYKAYIDHAGAIRVISKDGATKNYNWISREEGSFCVRNNMRYRKGGASCGFFEDKGDGTYDLYKVRGAKSRDGAVVHYNKRTLMLTVSDLQKGYQLKGNNTK